METSPVNTTFHYNTPDALWKCLERMPNLQEISLRLRGSGELVPLLKSHLVHNPNLPTLDTVRSISLYTATSSDISKFLKLMPNLENASIKISECVCHCPLLLALSKLPRLKYLMLCRVVPRPRRDSETWPVGWVVDDIEGMFFCP